MQRNPSEDPLQILLSRRSHCPLEMFAALHYRPVSVQHRSPRTNTFAGLVTHACSFSAIARRAFRCRSLANQGLQWLHPPLQMHCSALRYRSPSSFEAWLLPVPQGNLIAKVKYEMSSCLPDALGFRHPIGPGMPPWGSLSI